jgi:hypothetical protein
MNRALRTGIGITMAGLLLPAAAARPAQAQETPIDLRAGYNFTHYSQHEPLFSGGVMPIGFAVQFARDWRETTYGQLALAGQFSAAFGSPFEDGSDQYYTFLGGFRLTREEMGNGMTPFGELLIGLSHHRATIDEVDAGFSDNGFGGEVAGGVIMPIGDPAAQRNLVIRVAIGLFGSDAGGISAFQVGAFLKMQLGG